MVCRVKYGNSLPDIPFDPKFISYPFEPNRFIHYAPTSLERQYKYELLTEHDLGVHVDLILPEAYEKPEEQYVSGAYIKPVHFYSLKAVLSLHTCHHTLPHFGTAQPF